MKIIGSLSVIALASSSLAFSNLVVFGDSLSDTGNVYAATSGAYPAAPYFNGRFSNGPVWVEHLSTSLGLGAVTPSLLGGYDYAYGGAETGTGLSHSSTPNTAAQVTSYLGGHSPTGNELMIEWAGGNDLLNGNYNTTQIAGNIINDLTNLANAGGKHFLVGNLPFIGYTPTFVGTSGEALANQVSHAFNVALAADLATFVAGHVGVDVHVLDAEAFSKQAHDNPASFGFTNNTQQLIKNLNDPNPDAWQWWDAVHPTRAGHTVIANFAQNAVPEPASLFAIGLGVAALLRRKKS